MLSRYQMKRGVPASRLPAGVRQDTRKHTRHVLRPEAEAVQAYLADPSTFPSFAARYRAVLEERFALERDAFDRLAEQARGADVFLGCSCPTAAVPDVRRCHTYLALKFMAEKYPDLDVRLPTAS